MDPYGEVLDYAREHAKKNGYGGENQSAYMCGVLASQLVNAREDHARYVKQIEQEKNPNQTLEMMAQEIRASELNDEDQRDELVDFLKHMIRELEDLEFEEYPDEDFAYEVQKDLMLEAEA